MLSLIKMITSKRILSSFNRDICQKCFRHTAPFSSAAKTIVGEMPMVLFSRSRKLSLPKFKYRSNSTLADKKYTSVRPEEVDKFENMSGSWWDHSRGQMKELHSMNKLRYKILCINFLRYF